MKIQINTDRNIETDDRLSTDVEEAIESALGRFAHRITRVEVHLSDLNAAKGGRDRRCVMDARVAGLNPVAVDEQAHTPRDAVRGAAGKLERALDTRLGRIDKR